MFMNCFDKKGQFSKIKCDQLIATQFQHRKDRMEMQQNEKELLSTGKVKTNSGSKRGIHLVQKAVAIVIQNKKMALDTNINLPR